MRLPRRRFLRFAGTAAATTVRRRTTSIKQTFASMADKLHTPPFDRLLCSGRCTYLPEQMYAEGKIILLDVPTTDGGRSAELLQIDPLFARK